MDGVGILVVDYASLARRGRRVPASRVLLLSSVVLVVREFFARSRRLLLTWPATTKTAHGGNICGRFFENHPLGRREALACGAFGSQPLFDVLPCGRSVPMIAPSEYGRVVVRASLDALTCGKLVE